MIKLSCFLTFISFILASQNSVAVVNGITVEIDEYKSVAQLLVIDKKNNAASCSGFFISDSTLITAAHCVQDSKKVLLASFGAEKIKKKPTANNVILHPNFNAEKKLNDIAVIIFQNDTAKTFEELNLNEISIKEIQSSELVIVGYGFSTLPYENDPGYKDYSKLLKRKGSLTPIRIFQSSSESLHGEHIYSINEGISSGNTATSPGDSGAPVFFNSRVIGVLSSGRYNSEKDEDTSFTWLLSSEYMMPLWQKAKEAGASGL